MPQFEYTNKDKTVTVYEGATAFYIVNLATGDEVCMSDGVDMFVSLETGESLMVDSPEFYTAMREMAEDPEIFTAYFGEV